MLDVVLVNENAFESPAVANVLSMSFKISIVTSFVALLAAFTASVAFVSVGCSKY